MEADSRLATSQWRHITSERAFQADYYWIRDQASGKMSIGSTKELNQARLEFVVGLSRLYDTFACISACLKI